MLFSCFLLKPPCLFFFFFELGVQFQSSWTGSRSLPLPHSSSAAARYCVFCVRFLGRTRSFVYARLFSCDYTRPFRGYGNSVPPFSAARRRANPQKKKKGWVGRACALPQQGPLASVFSGLPSFSGGAVGVPSRPGAVVRAPRLCFWHSRLPRSPKYGISTRRFSRELESKIPACKGLPPRGREMHFSGNVLFFLVLVRDQNVGGEAE